MKVEYTQVELDDAVRAAYEFSKAAIIAAPVMISGRRYGGTPGSMPIVLDRQVGEQEAGHNKLPLVANTYALRDFALDQINKKLAGLEASDAKH